MEDEPQTHHSADRTTIVLRWVVGFVLGLVILGGAAVAYAYLTTTVAIRKPASTHFHFRMQIVSSGKSIDFSQAKFQTEFNKDLCTAKITKQPFHFHDGLDQFVHVHWAHMTGGLLLKNYGWNLIGGANNTLGYRFDNLPKISHVPVHGQDLPKVDTDTNYFIYTGDANGYRQRDWSSFLHKDLETFFDPNAPKQSWLQKVINPTAAAADMTEEEHLTMLNHVLGNVVIFAQSAAPSPGEITAKFQHLVALPESACGG